MDDPSFSPVNKKLIYPLILLLFSVITHFYHLGEPEGVIFDEVHFGKFVNSYCCSGERIFDIHPPHSKLMIAGTAKLLGYDGAQRFKKIGEHFSEAKSSSLRFLPAVWGVLLVLVIYFLLLELGASSFAAFFGGLLLAFDNAILVQTRVIALDGLLLFSIFGSMLVCFLAKKQTQEIKRNSLFLLSGGIAALAVGSKFTGLVALVMPFFYSIVSLYNNKTLANLKLWLVASAVFLFAFSVIYLTGYYLHFSLLDQPGPGDAWGKLTGSFFKDLIWLHQTMLTANSGLTAAHHEASDWWSWPFMHTPIFYWSAPNKVIYLIGNPFVWWFSTILFFVGSITLLLMRMSNLSIVAEYDSGKTKPLLWFPLLGYLISFAPLVFVSRKLFLYHYFTPLIFSLLFVVLWLDYIGWIGNASFFKQRTSVHIFLAFSLVTFFLLLPMTLGTQNSAAIGDAIFGIFPGWR